MRKLRIPKERTKDLMGLLGSSERFKVLDKLSSVVRHKYLDN